MWMAISVEFGPGMKLVLASRSKKSFDVSQCRRVTTSSCILAMCAAGPPNTVEPNREKRRATSRSAAAEVAAEATFGSRVIGIRAPGSWGGFDSMPGKPLSDRDAGGLWLRRDSFGIEAFDDEHTALRGVLPDRLDRLIGPRVVPLARLRGAVEGDHHDGFWRFALECLGLAP